VTIRGAWEKTAGHAVCGMGAKDLSGLGGPLSIGVAETVATADYDVLLLRCVSAPLAADHNFSGTLDLVMGVQEASSSDADMAFYLHIFVTQGDTDNLRGTLARQLCRPQHQRMGDDRAGQIAFGGGDPDCCVGFGGRPDRGRDRLPRPQHNDKQPHGNDLVWRQRV
jgi:hypothetical protein